jgi:phage tail-like protein
MASDSPVAASRFGLSVDGVNIATFSELQGITTKVDVIEFREATADGVRISKIPGATAPEGEVKFKMAMGSNLEMNSWLEAAQAGKMEQARKSCSLVMFDAENKPVARFYLENAWPSKCVLSPLRAGGNDVLVQEWSIVYETIQRVL